VISNILQLFFQYTKILQNLSQVTFEDLKRVYNKVYLTNQANAKNHESKAARVYFALCAVQSGRSSMDAAEYFLSQMNTIAKESKQFSGMAISAIATIAQRVCSSFFIFFKKNLVLLG